MMPTRTGRWPSLAKRAAPTAALGLVFLLALAASTLLHLSTPVGRALLTEGLNRTLAPVFLGSVRLEGLARVGFDVLGFSGVSVEDEHGSRVLHLTDVSVHLSLPRLLSGFFAPTERLIELPSVRAELAEVTLIDDPQYGSVTLARALTPRPTTPARAGKGPARPTTILLPSVEVGRVIGHFRMASLAALEPQLASVHGSVRVTDSNVDVDVERFGLTLGGLGVPVQGTATVQVRVPMSVGVQFSGFVSDSDVQSTFDWRQDAIAASVVAPKLSAATIAKLWPEWPLKVPVSAQVRAVGTFDDLEVDARVTATSPTVQVEPFPSEAHVQGHLSFVDGARGQLATQVSDFSLDLLDAAWPASRLNAELETTLTYTDTEFRQETRGRLAATLIEQIPIPEVSLRLETDAHGTEVEAQILEPDAHGELRATYLASGDGSAHLRIGDLSLGSRRLPKGLRGNAQVELDATTRNGSFTVNGNATIRNLETGKFRVGAAKLTAKTTRALETASQGSVQLSVAARDITFDKASFGNATASGTLENSALRGQVHLSDSDGRDLKIRARYEVATGQLRDVELEAARGDLVGRANIPLIDPAIPVVEVESLNIERTNCKLAACPHASAHGRYSPGLLALRVIAQNIALERLWPVLGLSSPVHGLVDADVDLNLGTDRERGDVSVVARDLSLLGYPKTGFDFGAHLYGAHVDAELAANNALGIVVAGRAAAVLDGPPLSARSWERLTGALEVTGQLETLETLRLVVPELSDMSLDGRARAKLTAQRNTPDGYPTASAEVDVRELSFGMTRGDTKVRFDNHRLYVNSTLDAEHATLYASVLVDDGAGVLLRANGQLPLSLNDGVEINGAAPLLVNATLEPRDIGSVPYFHSPISGVLDGQLTIYGTFAAPEARTNVRVTAISTPTIDDQVPLSLQGSVHYALAPGTLSGELLGTVGGQSVLLGRADGTLPWAAPEFRGRARVGLDRFPLSAITQLANLEMAGSATGLLELSDTPEPTAKLRLELEGLSASGHALGRGALSAHAERARLHATFEVQNGTEGARVTFDALAAAADLPTPERIHTIDSQVQATQLNAAIFNPVLGGLLARPSGDLDANVSLQWKKDPSTGHWHNTTKGIAHLRRGRAYVEGLGIELQDVTLDVVATPFGEDTHVAIDRIRTRARSEVVNVEGRGQLILSGAKLMSGSVNALFHDVPLTLQGLNVGKASGAASAQLQRREGWPEPGPHFGKPYLLVNATLGNWRVRASSSASRSLVDTTANPEIFVVQGQVIEERTEILPYRIIIDLGRDTRFSLSDLDIPLSGETRIDYAEHAAVSGTLILKRGGRVPLLGHVFEVQNGTLKLNPNQPSNPNIDIELTGKSNDGSPVDVSLTGTLQAPLVTPPLGQLSDLLGGGTATALSGGVQALGLNALLGDSIQLRVGSDSDDQELARYSAAVQVRENLWFEVNYAKGETNAFRTDNNNAISGTLDYRFDDNWSLKTEAGTTGGSVDVVWQYRY